MVTIQALIGYRLETLESFATRFTQLVTDQCSASEQEIIWNDVQYGYNFLVLAISCHENLKTGLPEHMIVKAIQGDDAVYVVQKAWKYEPNDGELEGWFEELGSFIIICGKIMISRCAPNVWCRDAYIFCVYLYLSKQELAVS